MNKRFAFAVLVIVALIAMALPISAHGDAVELHITWYDDGTEGAVLRDLLDRFEAEHPNIKGVIDTVAYADLHTLLQAQVETGEAPDMARITFPARFLGSYLDLTPYVADPQYWLDNIPEAVLGSMQADAEDTGIYGYPTQFTVTGPFINVTLFEQAGVEIPADDATWEEWVAAATAVSEALSDSETTIYPVAIDRTGHRFWGPSLSRCATYINEDGTFTVDSPGFRSTAEMILGWHNDGLMPADVWGGSAGNYVPAAPYFIGGPACPVHVRKLAGRQLRHQHRRPVRLEGHPQSERGLRRDRCSWRRADRGLRRYRVSRRSRDGHGLPLQRGCHCRVLCPHPVPAGTPGPDREGRRV
jgi:ABC-type glycerol-3-phosphate transport system substrate-binding protein